MRFKLTQRASRWPAVVRILLLSAAVFFCIITGAGSVTAQTTDDHGNYLDDATNLPLGSSIAGRIDPGDDLDVFKLDLSGASGDTHVWIYTTGGLDTLGGLYDSNEDLIASNDDTTSGGVIVETNFRIPRTLVPGVYYVGVESADGTTTGDYTLHAKADDHGHYFDTATPLALGASAAGRIDPGFDRDVFKLDLSGTSGTTDVWIYATGELNTRGWLYDSSGDLLVFNNDSYTAGRETSFSLRRNLPRGVYYISVRSWLTADGDFATGDYTLHAEAVTGPGSATGTATTLSLDSPTPGVIDMASDADYFRLALAESRNLVVHANNPFFRYDTSGLAIPVEPLDVTMLDSQGAEISVNILRVSYGVSIEDDFGPGAYYVKVTAPADDTTYPVPYTIHAYEDTDYTQFIADCEAATVSLNNPQISDPLYGCQWHLRNQEQGGEDINVEPVWAEGINGEGVNIAVVDDTMDYSHEDLAGNINSSLNHDYGGMGGAYRPFDHHGTAVAGIIAARDNGAGVRGVAPRATVYGYNYLAGDWQQFEDINRAGAMSRNRVVTSVSNNSWGPTDGPWLGYANQLWELAVDSGTREGYDGKGVFYAWAGGNGGGSHLENPDGTPVGGHFVNLRDREDNSNYDEFANYHAVTAVCAVNDQDTRSVYSEKGANLWVCAPSSGDSDQGHRGIVTTENSDRYQDDFGGTSAATPIVSGVAALLRQANPDLTWRDLKLILAASARKNDAANPGWAEGARKYGSGSAADRYHFNHGYGFGVVDAKAAVDLARGWTNVPPMENASAESGAAVEIPPPQADGTPQTVTTTLTLDTDIRFTEFVEINTDFEHTSFRDMDIELVSPSGAVSKLTVPFNTRHYTATYRRADGTTFDGPYFVRLDGEFRFGSARHLGEDPNGVWTLRLTDHFTTPGGTLRSWNIKVYGHVSRPGAPTITAPIIAGADSLTVAWSAPSDSGGPAITAYDLRYIETSADETMDENWTVLEDVWTTGSGPLNYTITGLMGGTQYDVQVRAVSSVMDGVWSATSTGTPSLIVSSDRDALVALYNATDGPNWTNNTNWLSDRPLGEWYGVTTDAGGRVTEIDLSENGLTGRIPFQLGNLTRLRTLVLWGGNQLTGAIPSQLGDLANLRGLYLAGNQLSGPIPSQLGDLANLQWLYLQGNRLSGPIPSQLGDLANLEALYLAGNQLSGPIPSQLGDLANLEALALSGNQLSGPIPSQLGSLSNLKDLLLHGNQLTGEIPGELGSLANLQGLYLGDNQLTGPIPSQLGNLANLRQLSLQRNRLSGPIPFQLGNLTNLVRLYLAGNQLIGCVPPGLAEVENNDLDRLGLPFCGGALGTPIISAVTPGAGFLTVAWSATAGTGGPAVSAYDLRYIQTSADETVDANWTVVDNAWTIGSGALSYRISGLSNGTQYDLQVRAVTATGDGPWSSTATGTPALPTGASATRSFSAASVAPGGTLTVTITAANYGVAGGVTETLPAGFSYVSSSLDDAQVTEVDARTVRFTLHGDTSFTYTVTASGVQGSYTFSGTLRDSDRNEHAVGGAAAVTVSSGDPLVARYDANGNGTIEKNEVIRAINDYLFGTGADAPSKADVIRLINLYLFG